MCITSVSDFANNFGDRSIRALRLQSTELDNAHGKIDKAALLGRRSNGSKKPLGLGCKIVEQICARIFARTTARVCIVEGGPNSHRTMNVFDKRPEHMPASFHANGLTAGEGKAFDLFSFYRFLITKILLEIII